LEVSLSRPILTALLLLTLTGCGVQPSQPVRAAVQTTVSLSAQDVDLVKRQIKGLMRHYFDYLDVNNDGKVSKKEMARQAPATFLMNPYFDHDKDGYLSFDELLDMMGHTVETAVKVLYVACDLDFDGKVTRDDATKVPFGKYLFSLMDKDDDGVVSRAEMEKFVTNVARIKNPF
jgi:Ca2+-binding EF-hand superfamily protein